MVSMKSLMLEIRRFLRATNEMQDGVALWPCRSILLAQSGHFVSHRGAVNHLRSTGLWLGYISITITVLDIIHLSVCYLEHNVLKTGVCVCLQLELTQVSPVNRASLCLRIPEQFYPDADRTQSPKCLVLNKKTGRLIMSRLW
jgi:hypothetical protein